MSLYASSIPANRDVHSIQHSVMKFISDLWQVGGFLWYYGFLHK